MTALILVVDDDPDIRDSLQSALESEGFGVVAARNGREAVNWARGAVMPPSIILLDLQMPVMDGEEFLLLQSSEPLLAGIPVVVMTAQILEPVTPPPTVRAVLRKPVRLSKIFDLIRTICANA